LAYWLTWFSLYTKHYPLFTAVNTVDTMTDYRLMRGQTGYESPTAGSRHEERGRTGGGTKSTWLVVSDSMFETSRSCGLKVQKKDGPMVRGGIDYYFKVDGGERGARRFSPIP
jgi:hypothetical protein